MIRKSMKVGERDLLSGLPRYIAIDNGTGYTAQIVMGVLSKAIEEEMDFRLYKKAVASQVADYSTHAEVHSESSEFHKVP